MILNLDKKNITLSKDQGKRASGYCRTQSCSHTITFRHDGAHECCRTCGVLYRRNGQTATVIDWDYGKINNG